jgi:hypothetical protein
MQFLTPAPELGVHIRVVRNSGEVVEGWFLDDSVFGLLISLDSDGNRVRWLPPFEAGRVIEYQWEEPRARFAETGWAGLGDLTERLTEPMTNLLTRIDANRLRALGQALSNTTDRLARTMELSYEEPVTPPWDDPDIFVTARQHYGDLVAVLEHSHAPAIVEIMENSPSSQTLRTIESSWERSVIADGTARMLRDIDSIAPVGAETQHGSSALQTERLESLSGYRVAIVTERLLGPEGDDFSNPGRGRRFRWTAGWLRVVGGGLIAVVDIAGGVAMAIGGPPAMAIGAAGVATSLYKGVSLAAEGLDELGRIADGLEPAA